MNAMTVNHVQQTIDEASVRIGQLQDLVKGLHLLKEWSAAGEVRSAECGMRSEGPGKTPQATNGQARVQASGRGQKREVGTGGRGGVKLREQAARVRGLAEPFKAGDVEAATGATRKAAQNFCTQGLNKGWLTRVGYGEYRRTKGFPNGESGAGGPKKVQATPGQSESGKGPAKEEHDLDAQLAARTARRQQVEEDLAVAQRDLVKHQRNGNDTLARILGDKVLKLQGEYDELS